METLSDEVMDQLVEVIARGNFYALSLIAFIAVISYFVGELVTYLIDKSKKKKGDDGNDEEK